MRADRSADISTSISPKDPIRALTKRRRIKPTSPRCPSAWQPNPGRGSTYRRGDSVQTTGTTSDLGHQRVTLRTPTMRSSPNPEAIYGDCSQSELLAMCDRLGFRGTVRAHWLDLF